MTASQPRAEFLAAQSNAKRYNGEILYVYLLNTADSPLVRRVSGYRIQGVYPKMGTIQDFPARFISESDLVEQ